MLNILKMDLYRMFKSKSLWIIWIVMILLIVGTSYLNYTEIEMESSKEQTEMSETAAGENEPVNLGMSVFVPTEPGEDVTVFDMVYANLQGKFIALFIVIFAVMFSTADITSGYIKNIGGQVRSRGQLILSKALLLFLYTVLTLVLFILVQALSNQIFLGYVEWGDAARFLQYVGTETLLHYAMALICMAIAIIARNNVFSMIASVLLCMNFMVILYSFVDKAIAKTGVKDFNLLNYTVTGKMSMLSMDITRKDIIGGVCVAAVFVIITTLLSSLIFEKRDI